jgi:hypothetical protein
MGFTIIDRNYTTKYAKFSIDTQEDLLFLPRIGIKGQGKLSTINEISQGSIAEGTNGVNYILTGQNEWIEYNKSGSNASGTNSCIANLEDELRPLYINSISLSSSAEGEIISE